MPTFQQHAHIYDLRESRFHDIPDTDYNFVSENLRNSLKPHLDVMFKISACLSRKAGLGSHTLLDTPHTYQRAPLSSRPNCMTHMLILRTAESVILASVVQF